MGSSPVTVTSTSDFAPASSKEFVVMIRTYSHYKKEACKRSQNLSEEEKEKKQQNGCECYTNLSKDEK